jgi:hypothetical protein
MSGAADRLPPRSAGFRRGFGCARCSNASRHAMCSRSDRDMLSCNPQERCKNAARERIGKALVPPSLLARRRAIARLKLKPGRTRVRGFDRSLTLLLSHVAGRLETRRVLGGFYDFKPIRILFRRANAVRSSRDGYLQLDGERCTSADHSFRYVISGPSKSARPFISVW